MSYVKREDRNKIGIEWYATEEEALARVPSALEEAERKLDQGFDFGWLSIGRDRVFDKDGLFAVVIP